MTQHDTLTTSAKEESVDEIKRNVMAEYWALDPNQFCAGVTKGCVIDIQKVDYNNLSLDSLLLQVNLDETQIIYSVGPFEGFSGSLFKRNPDLVLCNSNLTLKLNHLNVRTLKKMNGSKNVIFTEEDNTVSLELSATLDPEAKTIRVDHLSAKSNKENVTVTIFAATFLMNHPHV